MTHTNPQADRLRRGDLLAYRRLYGLAAVATLLFGYIHRAANPLAVDSMSGRLALSLLCLSIVALTYVYPRRPLLRAIYFTFYAYTAWVLALLVANRFHPDYSIGAMVVIGAVSVGFLERRHLGAYLALTLGAIGVLVTSVPSVPSPQVDGFLYFSYVTLFCALAFIMLRGRLLIEEKLAASRLRYALAAQGANDGLWDWDLTTGRLFLSPRWNEMLGIDATATEQGDRPELWLDRIHPEDRERVETELALHQDGRSEHFQSEFRVRHEDGSWRWFLARGLAVRDAAGRATRMAGSQTDITVQKRAEEQLLHDAFHDALTGLPNRALLADRLSQVLHHSLRHREETFALLYLDLDRFKLVNDSMGHAAGDQLLKELGMRIVGAVRQEDTVARLGGDEFAVVLPNVSESEISRVISRIQAEIARPIVMGNRELVTTASIGVVLGPGDYTGPADLLRDADMAMYRSKAEGPGRYGVFDRALHDRTLALLEMEADLRGAAERGELRLHYQPIMSLDSGTIAGFEALVRWNHPEKGLLQPASFIPLAEDTGLIVPLGRWILVEAAKQAAQWGDRLTINVNVSGKQLVHPDFAAHVGQALRESGLDPARLHLEITESVLLQDPTAAINVLTLLRSLGVKLYLDDFGTGYSSFTYLHLFPIDAVKLDRSFVHNMDRDPRNGAIVRALVAMARTLGLAVVAEGVERAEEVVQLRGVECPFGQGFLFSRPVEADAAGRLVVPPPYLPVAGRGSA